MFMNIIHYIILVLVFSSCNSSEKIESVKVKSIESVEFNSNFGIHSLYFIDDKLGFALREDSVIFKTIDGGENWEKTILQSDCSLEKVVFNKFNKGYILGYGANLFTSDDTGRVWNRLNLNIFHSHDTFCGIEFINRDTVFIVGYNLYTNINFVIKSFDNGKTWLKETIPFGVFDISFLNNKIGYACGHEGILKSNDFWKSNKIYSNVPSQSIKIIDDTTALCLYYESVSISKDNCKTWSILKDFKNQGFSLGEKFSSIKRIEKLDKEWFILLYEDKLYKLNRKGDIFEIFLNNNDYIPDFQIIDNKTIYAIGSDGFFKLTL